MLKKKLIIVDCIEDYHRLYQEGLLKGNIKKKYLDEIEIFVINDPFEGIYQMVMEEVPIVIIDIMLDGIEVDKGLKLYKLITALFPKSAIIIFSQRDLEDIDKNAKKLEINIDKENYFYKGKKNEFQALRKKVIQEIKYLLLNQRKINDLWILERLNDRNAFRSLGIKRLIPLGSEIENAFRDHEKEKYSIWFSDKIYKTIFKDRISQILKSAGFKNIANSLENFMWFERMSYIKPFFFPEKRYRDHFLHQLRVAVLGDFLLNAQVKIGEEKTSLVDKIKDILNNRKRPHAYEFTFDEKSIRGIWWITALMHDCAYPLQSIHTPHLFGEDAINKLEQMYTRELYKQFIETHESTVEKLKKTFEPELSEMLDKIELKSFKEVILKAVQTKMPHNILSAYNFWKNFRQPDRKNFCYELVVQSILLHHEFCENETDEMSIMFEEYPIAFLLILVDEIQEWGRPLLLEECSDPTSITKVIELNEISVEGIVEAPSGSNEYILNEKGVNFLFDYKKISENYSYDQIKFKPDEKYQSKRKNLKRLKRQVGGILPPITFELQFKDYVHDPIKIE